MLLQTPRSGHSERHGLVWVSSVMVQPAHAMLLCRAGDKGSANATEAFRKLEGKVQQFMHEP